MAPNTPEERIHIISKLAGDLIYCVAILGITGSRGAGGVQLKSYLHRVEKNSDCPFIVGFGIEEREDVIAINQMAHGAVIGSAIIKEIAKMKNPILAVEKYIEKLIR